MHDAGQFRESTWDDMTSQANFGDDYFKVVDKDYTWVVEVPSKTKKKKREKLALTHMEHYGLEMARNLPGGMIVYTYWNETGANKGIAWIYEITFESPDIAVQTNTTNGTVRKLYRYASTDLPVLAVPVLAEQPVRTHRYTRSRSPPAEREPAASSSYQFESEPTRPDICPGFTRLDRKTGLWHATRQAANTSGPEALHEHPATKEMSTDADMRGGVWTQESQEGQSFYPTAFNAFSKSP